MATMRLMDVRGGSTATNVSITIIKVDWPPVLEPLAELQVVAGSEATADLVVHDPDGNVATLMVSGHQATARYLARVSLGARQWLMSGNVPWNLRRPTRTGSLIRSNGRLS